MGVSLECWRGSIGLFYGKLISHTKSSKYTNYVDFIMKKELWWLIIGLLMSFLYCTMIVTLVPLVLMFYLLCDILYSAIIPDGCPFLFCNSPFIILYAFLIINAIPKGIHITLNVPVLHFRKSVSVDAKKIAFYLMVLQTLLFLSGTVKLNPGPVKSKVANLSFAVWNLDSIPARNYARIPLIETFQSTYNVDIFGVCESLLNNDIPNEDIFVNGFSPEPFRAVNLKIAEMEGYVFFLKKTYQLKKGVTLNHYLKLL